MSHTHNPYSHFKGDDITRSEKVQREVVETILASQLPDEERSWSKVFELKHSSSVIQIGRILAEKRGLSIEIAEIICAMHDIYVNHSGRAEQHAHKGVAVGKEILDKIGKFDEKETELILRCIKNHSDKHVVSDDPYEELVKDADVLDCSMYEGAHDAYVYEKSLEICQTYFARVKKVREELGLKYDPQWDNFEIAKRD